MLTFKVKKDITTTKSLKNDKKTHTHSISSYDIRYKLEESHRQ
uniref:Uncharacterized protein n=1 Tax=Anguilla anguilla TaxID=7936 RepID=A0A0E9QZ18_ANGAN